MSNSQSAEQIASSVMDDLNMDFLAGTANVRGNPGLRAGDIVEPKDFGSNFGRKYLTSQARHDFAGASGASPARAPKRR